MIDVERDGIETRMALAGMYVRSHLDERLTLERIASVAGFSPFHFQRVFRVAFGETPAEYVQRHRLQNAARELEHGTSSITEIGLRCGYESSSAFGRAFLRAFGMTPSAYRAHPNAPALTAPAAIRVARDIAPRFETYAERAALGLRHVGAYDRVDGAMERLLEIAFRRGLMPVGRIIGLSYDSPDLEAHAALRFDACVTVSGAGDVAGARADGLRDLTIPGGAYAVFLHRGPYARITDAYDRLVAAWVLSGRITLRDAPFVNTYRGDPSRDAASDLECDLAIPVS